MSAPAAPASAVSAPVVTVKQAATRASSSTVQHAAASGFWVQVGAYRDTAAAGRVARQVNGEILVVAEPSSGGAHTTESPLLRVRVGPFVERTQALSKARDLQALGYKPFIAAGD